MTGFGVLKIERYEPHAPVPLRFCCSHVPS